MSCECQKPCGRTICCSICESRYDCKYVCKTCVPELVTPSKLNTDTHDEDSSDED